MLPFIANLGCCYVVMVSFLHETYINITQIIVKFYKISTLIEKSLLNVQYERPNKLARTCLQLAHCFKGIRSILQGLYNMRCEERYCVSV